MNHPTTHTSTSNRNTQHTAPTKYQTHTPKAIVSQTLIHHVTTSRPTNTVLHKFPRRTASKKPVAVQLHSVARTSLSNILTLGGSTKHSVVPVSTKHLHHLCSRTTCFHITRVSNKLTNFLVTLQPSTSCSDPGFN